MPITVAIIADGVYNISIGGMSMNNDEKILAVLERMESQLDSINTRLGNLEDAQSTMGADVKQLQGRYRRFLLRFKRRLA